MKILIADDSATMRMILKLNLKKAGLDGHEVREVADGCAALVAVAEWGPDVVLSDWNMPEMDGIDVLRALRGAGNTVPFGFLTAESTDEMRVEALDAGALFVLSKPFDSDVLRVHLEPVLA